MIRALAFAFLAGTCTPHGGAAPVTDAGPETSPEALCAHLAAIGCPMPPTCAAALRSKQGTATDFRPACLAAASSPAAAEACGSVKCGGAP